MNRQTGLIGHKSRCSAHRNRWRCSLHRSRCRFERCPSFLCSLWMHGSVRMGLFRTGAAGIDPERTDGVTESGQSNGGTSYNSRNRLGSHLCCEQKEDFILSLTTLGRFSGACVTLTMTPRPDVLLIAPTVSHRRSASHPLGTVLYPS
jgi:hypothetical protein